MMKRLLIVIELYALILVACAAPQSGAMVDQADEPQEITQETGPAETESPEPEPTATPADLEESQMSAALAQASTLPEGASQRPLSEGVVLTIWGERSGSLHIVDPDTGQALEGHPPVPLGATASRKVSPDGTIAAIIRYPSNESGVGGTLHLHDLTTWTETSTDTEFDEWVNALVFSPDMTSLAVAYPIYGKNMLQIVDLESGTLRAETEIDFFPAQIAFTPDSASLAVYGSGSERNTGVNPTAYAALYDASTLNEQWKQPLEDVRDGQYVEEGETTGDPHQGEWMMPGVVFAPDGGKVYIAHADEDRLTTVDFTTRSVTAVDIAPKLSLIERILALTAQRAHAKILNGTTKYAVLSPDGQSLYVIGQRMDSTDPANGPIDMVISPLGLQVIDVSDGTELARIETDANEVSISPDGSRLYFTGWSDEANGDPWTEVYDAVTFTLITRIEDAQLREVMRLDGISVLISTASGVYNSDIMILNREDFQPIIKWTIDGWVEWGLR
jgi:WD40 repeat protein